MIPSSGWQQSACVHCSPPDWPIRGVYIQQAADPQVFVHTFLPEFSGAATSSFTLHSQFTNGLDAVRGSADIPMPTESSSTNGRGNLFQPKQAVELRGRYCKQALHYLPCSKAERTHTSNTLPGTSSDRFV